MFDFIRTHRRWMQFILLVLILPSFVFVGVQGYTSFVDQEPDLAVVAGESVTRAEFDWALRNQIERYRQLLGNQFDATLLDTPAMREGLLDQLIDQRVIARAASDGRLKVSDEALRRTIAAIPDLQENGAYQPERYREFLNNQGMTDVVFEAGLRRDLTLARVLAPIGTSNHLPMTVAQTLHAALRQTRTVRTRTFAAADYREQIVVSEADLQAWYDANAAQLEVPAHVRADYVVLDEDAASQDITVQAEDIASYYEQNKHRYGQPERRRAAHILLTGEDAGRRAEDLAAQVQSQPERFAELASEHSQDSGTASRGGDLGWLGRGMLVAPVEDAIFALQPGQVSGAVQSQYGWHVIRLLEREAERVRPLADVRTEIEAEIRRQLAAQRFAEMAGKLTDLVYDQRDSLQPVVDTLGLTVRRADGIARDGLLSVAQVGEHAAVASSDAERLNDARVRQALFTPEVQRERLNSGVIELDPGVLMVVRVADVQPARVPPLATVAADIRARIVAERAEAAAAAAGEQFLADGQAGTLSAAALATLSAPQTVSRRAASGLSAKVLNAAMRVPAAPLPAYVGVADDEAYVVVQIDAVTEATDDASAELSALRDELAAAWGRLEEAAVLRLLREQYQARLQPAARTVLQGQPDGAL